MISSKGRKKGSNHRTRSQNAPKLAPFVPIPERALPLPNLIGYFGVDLPPPRVAKPRNRLLIMDRSARPVAQAVPPEILTEDRHCLPGPDAGCPTNSQTLRHHIVRSKFDGLSGRPRCSRNVLRARVNS